MPQPADADPPRVWRRLIVATVTTLAIVATIVLVRIVVPLINVATAYKAKVLCSEVFVAGRPPDDVASGLASDDLSVLRLISATVDTLRRTASTRLFPFARRVARFDESLGCVLAPRDRVMADTIRGPSEPGGQRIPRAGDSVDSAPSQVSSRLAYASS